MESIKLNNGTVLAIQSGATEKMVKIVAQSIDEIVAHFTDENLSQIEFLTEAGEVSAIYTKKHLKKFSAEATEDGFMISFCLVDRDEIFERIAALEQMIAELVAEKDVKETVATNTEE